MEDLAHIDGRSLLTTRMVRKTQKRRKMREMKIFMTLIGMSLLVMRVLLKKPMAYVVTVLNGTRMLLKNLAAYQCLLMGEMNIKMGMLGAGRWKGKYVCLSFALSNPFSF